MERGPYPPSASAPARILIAEDHLDSRAALAELLRAFGYEVLEAANGREAVELAREAFPDLVLMDIMMPEMDGFAATRELRRSGAMGEMPIIAVTAMDGARDIALAAGASDFVAKPVDSRMLLAKIERWLTPTAT